MNLAARNPVRLTCRSDIWVADNLPRDLSWFATEPQPIADKSWPFVEFNTILRSRGRTRVFDKLGDTCGAKRCLHSFFVNHLP